MPNTVAMPSTYARLSVSLSIFAAFAVLAIFAARGLTAQMPRLEPIPGEKVASDTALDRALERSTLTVNGRPFHAVMDIGVAGTPYSGKIELWWLGPSQYRLMVQSPSFSQLKIVNGDQVEEKDTGDYFPRWLENFVLMLLDPIPMVKNFRGGRGDVMLGPQIMRSCLRRSDRPNGVNDELTWGEICFSGAEPRLSEVLTTNVYEEFKDWKGFGKKQIARTYQTNVLAYQPVVGRLSTLEELKNPDMALFQVAEVTPESEQIRTAFVSTLKEESMVEKAPELHWPAVREGKTEGYMIVYARTDRTGQVRESAKHNSDNAELEQYGMEQALGFKFKPLVVDGVPEQMEMPLVLHFSSRIENPIPVLSVDAMKRQTVSCKVSTLPRGMVPSGTHLILRVTVSETGKPNEISPQTSTPGLGPAFVTLVPQIEKCRFAAYAPDGKTTRYKGDLEFIAP